MAIRRNLPGSPIDKLVQQDTRPTTFNPSPSPLAELFSNVTYTLPDGRYEAEITEVNTDNKSKWIIDYDLLDGTTFRHGVTIPLNRSFGLGRALYNVRHELNANFSGRDLVGRYVLIEIVNRTIDERTYSNVENLKFISDEEEDGNQ